MFVVSF